MSGDEQAGFYNIGFVILSAIYIFPSALYQKYLMPKFHRWANHDRNRFYDVYQKGNIVMLILGIIISVVIFASSDFFIPLLFGAQYVKSIELVNILALTLPFYLVAFSVASTLVTQEHMKRKVIYMGLVALFNVILNLILIPIYQAKGAAIATVVSNALLLAIYYYAANKYVFSDKKGTHENR
jgi:O-antigen/teichoic acid export membrane protein